MKKQFPPGKNFSKDNAHEGAKKEKEAPKMKACPFESLE